MNKAIFSILFLGAWSHATIKQPSYSTTIPGTTSKFTISDVSHPKSQYSFNYLVDDPITGDKKSHTENKENGVVRGEYSLNEPDGSIRTVTYSSSSQTGFVAQVTKSYPQVPRAKPFTVSTKSKRKLGVSRIPKSILTYKNLSPISQIKTSNFQPTTFKPQQLTSFGTNLLSLPNTQSVPSFSKLVPQVQNLHTNFQSQPPSYSHTHNQQFSFLPYQVHPSTNIQPITYSNFDPHDQFYSTDTFSSHPIQTQYSYQANVGTYYTDGFPESPFSHSNYFHYFR